MSTTKAKYPFYIKYFAILGGVALTCFIIVYLRSFFNPLLLAIVFALALSPLCSLLDKWLPKLLSSFLCVALLTLLLLCIFLMLSYEIATINLDINIIFDKAGNYIDAVKQWGAEKLHIAVPPQIDYLKSSITSMGKDVSSYVNYFVTFTTSFLTGLVFFLLSLFFLLYYRRFLVAFFFRLTSEKQHEALNEIIKNIKRVLKRYITGLTIDISIVAVLNVIGLLILGTPHAFFFGILAAVLLVIPYVGILIGASLPTLYMLMVTDSLWYPFAVIIIFSFIQLLEGNFIYPNVVGNQVGLNPFIIIMGLLMGGLLLGLVGIVITIPLLSVVKVIFDNIPALKPFGFIMGEPPNRLT